MLLAIMLASQTAWADNIEITSANFTDYFDYDEEFDMQIGNSSATIVSNVGGYFLKESVAEGTTLDFKGDFTPPTDGKNPRVFINKRVNITSSDKSAVFKSGDTGLYWCFGVVEGGDNAEVKNLQFDNCWVFIHGASYVTFDGIDLQVHDANIGSGYGAFSIATLEDDGPLSEYATLKNSNFNFTNNGISAIVVVGRGGSHATIDNNTVEVGTNVGNMLSSTVYLGKGDQPEFVTYSNNVITREGASTSSSFAIAIIGAGNVVENNKIHYAGAAITTGFGSTLNDNTPNIYRNNTITGGGSMGTNTYGVVENNHVSGQLTIAKEVKAICNTTSKLFVNGQSSITQSNTVYGDLRYTSGTEPILIGNLVMGNLLLENKNAFSTITGNAVISSGEYAIPKKTVTRGNTIEYNWLVAAEKRGDEAVDPTIGTENTIQNNISDATVITDETTTLTATENGAFYVVPANTAVTIPGDLTVKGSGGQRVNIILSEGATLTINGKLAASGKTVGIYAMTNDETTGSVTMNAIDYQELFISSGIVTVDGVVYSGHYGEPGSVEEVINYDLWVAGTQVTSANADDLSVIEGVTGSAQYDADNNTLTLSGATITGGSGNDACGGAIVYTGTNDFRIDVSGTNTVTGDTRREQSMGIYMGDPDDYYNMRGADYNTEINIAEGAVLTVNAGKAEGGYYPTSTGLMVSSLGEFTITNAGTLNVNGGGGTYNYGLFGSRVVTLNGTGTTNATAIGGTVYDAALSGCGIVINDGNITAKGGDAETSYGISAEGGEYMGLGDININGGTILATGGTRAIDKAPVLASGMAAKGSTSIDGTGAVRYVADDNATYKWFSSFPYEGTTYNMELASEYKAVPTVYAGCQNYFTLKVENTGEVAGSNVHASVYDDGVLVWEGTIDNLPVGEAKDLEVVDPTIRPVTANTVIGNDNENVGYQVVIEDANGSEEQAEFPFVVLYNGNLGKDYAYTTSSPTSRDFSFDGDVQILTGDGYSTNSATSREDEFAVDLAGGSVHKALLYVSYNWDKVAEGDFNNWSTSFNDESIAPLASYRDQGNLGNYGAYGYGLVVYDVTDFVVDGNNTFALEKTSGNVAVYPSSLIVMVENTSGKTQDVYIVEEADLLSTQYNQHVDTIYPSTFQGVAAGDKATLYVFAANAQSGEGDLEINGNLQTDVWNGTSNSLEVYEASVETGDISIQFKATGSTILALHQMVVVSKTSTGIVSVDNALSIDDCFDLQGRRINKPQKGVTIIRTSDGKTRKVMVK